MAEVPARMRLHESDIAIIVVYFVFIIFVGVMSSRMNRGSVGGYFLAGRSMHFMPVGASLFASNIGSLHFVGLAGSGAAVGISNYIYEINAIFVLVLLGWLFLPVYIASGITTMPEYLRKRLGGQRIRVYLAILSLLLYIFTKISADLFSGAMFIEQALGWNIWGAIVLLLIIAAIFTILGGLTAVIWTDFIQTIIMIIGALVLMGLALAEVGGIEGMRYKYERSLSNDSLFSNSTCGHPRKDYFHLMRSPKTGDIPWPGLFGAFVNSIWYWCADQVIVQRSLAAKNYSHAKAGVIVCGYIKFLPIFLLVFPGMIARILYPDELACVDPEVCKAVCGNPVGCSNIAYPLLVINLMPNGARGLMLAVMLSALMSSLTSIFNSSSTVFTIDIWKKARKQASDTEMMIVGRVCVLVLVGVSIAWVPVIQAAQGSQLFEYIQQISSYLTPPICAVYMLAILTSRLNEKGAFWALIIGLFTGIIRFILDFAYSSPACGEEDQRPDLIKNFHFLYFALFLFFFTGLLAMLGSIATEPIPSKHLHRLTFWTRNSKEEPVEMDTGSIVDQEGVIEDSSSDDDDDDKKSMTKAQKCGKATGDWICGIEKMGDAPQLTEEEIKAIKEKLNSIKEKPKTQMAADINCVILLFFSIFVWGFFG